MRSHVILFVLLAAFLEAQACVDDSDCSFNGKCAAAACACDDAWTGGQCDRFNFAPLSNNTGRGLRTREQNGTYSSSWGGSVLLGEDGLYHMWASEMTYSTGIKAWLTNSQIIHAVADDPTRPFAFRRTDVIHGVFAHEPTVSRSPTGEWVMYFTSNYGERPGTQCAPPCTCGFNGTSCLQCLNDQQCDASPQAPLSSFMSYALSPNGPWSDPVHVPAPTHGDTNLACLIYEDSSLVCLGRPGLGRMAGADWRNVSSYKWTHTAGDPIIGEDPMIWRNPGSDTLHAITHGGGWGAPFGFHYFSEDRGHTWRGTGNKAYQNVVQQQGGGQIILSRRERPHVVLNAHGAIVGVTHGVTEAWPCTLEVEPDRPPCKHPPTPGKNPHCGPGSNGTSIWCPVDASYTLFQAVKDAHA